MGLLMHKQGGFRFQLNELVIIEVNISEEDIFSQRMVGAIPRLEEGRRNIVFWVGLKYACKMD